MTPPPNPLPQGEGETCNPGRILCLAFLLLFVLPLAAHAQSVNIDLGAAGQAGATSRIIQLTALVTVLSLAPSLLVMVTAFTRIVIVLSLLRSALATQSTPPNMVLIGLALVPDVLRHAADAGPGLDAGHCADGRRPHRRDRRHARAPSSRSTTS